MVTAPLTTATTGIAMVSKDAVMMGWTCKQDGLSILREMVVPVLVVDPFILFSRRLWLITGFIVSVHMDSSDYLMIARPCKTQPLDIAV
jgi:hypothetical protein